MIPGWEAYHKFPALILSLLVAIGIWVGSQVAASHVLLLFIMAAVATLLAAATLLLRQHPAAVILRSLCCVLLCPAVGALKYRVDDTPGTLVPAMNSRMLTTLIGEVAEAPSTMGNRQRFLLQARAVVSGDSTVPCSEKGLVTCIAAGDDPAGSTLQYGSVVALRGVVESPSDAGNPGEFSPRQYYNANGISFLMRVRGGESVRILDSTRGTILMRAVVYPLRRFILAEIDRDIGGEEGEFLKGLLIGERSGLSPGVRRAFLDSGVAHILAVSGSNVAVVAMAIVMVLSLVRIPRSAGRVFTAAGLVIYMLVTGAQPPVVRATIMAMAFLISGSLTRKVHPLNSVGLSAIVMFTMDARQMFDVGFQLSFGAVLAILVLYPRLMAMLPRRERQSRIWGLAQQVFSVVAVSLAASVGTLPLTAIVFGRLSLVGFLANLVIVPASGVSVVLGMISPLVAPVSAWVGSAYAEVNRVVLLFTIMGAELAASVPWATMDTVWFRPIHALPYYAGLACIFSLGQPPAARQFLLVFLFTANVSLFWPSTSLAGTPPSELRVTMIDVGQGDAVLIQPPGGRNVLIDTGPPPRDGSPWGTAVIPLLKRLGVQSLDALIITHMHDDHAGGLAYILRSCDVRQLIVDPVTVRSFHLPAGSMQTMVRAAARGAILGDSVCRFYVVSPDAIPPDSSGNANRLSVVVKLRFREVSMLFMGDAESGEEAGLIARYGGFLTSNVLKVGHHGSKAGTSDEFLSTVRPGIALISVGRYNRFGHPARPTLHRLHVSGAEVLRTDEIGAIILSTDGTSIHQMQWR